MLLNSFCMCPLFLLILIVFNIWFLAFIKFRLFNNSLNLWFLTLLCIWFRAILLLWIQYKLFLIIRWGSIILFILITLRSNLIFWKHIIYLYLFLMYFYIYLFTTILIANSTPTVLLVPGLGDTCIFPQLLKVQNLIKDQTHYPCLCL